MITITTDDEWEGLYVNGVLIGEDAQWSVCHILDLLGIKHSRVRVDAAWLAAEGNYPDRLEDVKHAS